MLQNIRVLHCVKSMPSQIDAAKIRVFIVDDHPTLRFGIVALVNDAEDMQVVGEASDGKTALDTFESLAPDVIVLDLQLPDIQGEDVIAKVLARAPNMQIIVLTTYGGSDTIKRTINAGAKGFMLKDAVGSQVVEAIRHVHKGKRFIEGVVAERYAQAIQDDSLTERELEILKIVAQGNANKAIAYELSISEATVKNHMASILNKLKAKDRTDAIMIALQRGLIRLN
jgi:DNA-binding NarL/FixJ family response regulator